MSKIMIGTDEVLKVMFGLDEVSSLAMGGETIPITPPTPPAPVYSAMPFTVEALESGHFVFTNTFTSSTLNYRVNEGVWVSIPGTGFTINVSENDIIEIKGNWPGGVAAFTGTTCMFDVYGNIMSLKYGDNFNDTGNTIPLNSVFKNSKVRDASNLHISLSNRVDEMFNGCSGLTAAPDLSRVTTSMYACFSRTFGNCSSLERIEYLPTGQVGFAFMNTFDGCTNLSYVKCLATNPSTSMFSNWLKGVSATGTFVKDANTTWPSGNSGIPTGWTVVNA